jgi:hypothetical protein
MIGWEAAMTIFTRAAVIAGGLGVGLGITSALAQPAPHAL